MTTINKTALVPYSASEMYALVNDIGSYSKFLPWCRSSQILEQGEDVIRATIEIAHGSLHKSFTTNNRLQRDKMIEKVLSPEQRTQVDELKAAAKAKRQKAAMEKAAEKKAKSATDADQ